MSAIHDLAIEGSSDPSGPKSQWASIATGATLILLLIFSTSTVFVQESWPAESFQIGIFALTAAYLLFGVRREKENLAAGLDRKSVV